MNTVVSQDGAHRLELRGGMLYAFTQAPREVHITTVENGEVKQETKTYEELFQVPGPDLFHAAPDSEPGKWIVDVDCGFQRWWGNLSSRKLYAGIRKLGFTDAQIRHAVSILRKKRQHSA